MDFSNSIVAATTSSFKPWQPVLNGNGAPRRILCCRKQDRLAAAKLERPSICGTQGVPSQTELERRIATVWCRVLRRNVISVTNNFFELGGHSLSGMCLVSEIGEAFRIDLPVRAVFEAPTIEESSREIVLRIARLNGWATYASR